MCRDAKSVTWPWTSERCVTRCSYPSPECLRCCYSHSNRHIGRKRRDVRIADAKVVGTDLSQVIHNKNYVTKASKTLTHETRWHWNLKNFSSSYPPPRLPLDIRPNMDENVDENVPVWTKTALSLSVPPWVQLSLSLDIPRGMHARRFFWIPASLAKFLKAPWSPQSRNSEWSITLLRNSLDCHFGSLQSRL